MISYLPLHRKTVKWWKKLAFHLLTLVMIQAHCLFNKFQTARNRKTYQLDKFVRAVCFSQALLPMIEEEDEQVRGDAGPQGDDLYFFF